MGGPTSGKIYKGRVKNRINLQIGLLNYCYHSLIDTNIKKDPWCIWNQLQEIVNGWQKSFFETVFPILQSFPPTGKDSSIISGVYTDKQICYLFGMNKKSRILYSYDETVEDNLVAGLKHNFLHIFPVKESAKNPPHIIKFIYNQAQYHKYKVIDSNNYDTPVAYNLPVTLPVNKKYYIIALPYLLTPTVFDYIKTLLASPDSAPNYNVFSVSTYTSDLQIYDKRNEKNNLDDYHVQWYLPVFNPFFTAMILAKALKRCMEFHELQNPSSPVIDTDFYHKSCYGFKNKNQIKCMKEKSMYLSIMMSLCERDSDVKSLIDHNKLKKSFDFHNRWLTQGARLFEVLSYMLQSTFFIQLEEAAVNFDLESKKNGQYWVKLFMTIAPVLQAHDKGCAILARRFSEIDQKKQTSPVSVYSKAVFSNVKSSKALQIKTAAWGVEPWVGKTSDAVSAFFNGYAYYKLTNFTKLKPGDLKKINDELGEAADAFIENMPSSSIKVTWKAGKGIQKSLGLAKKLSDIAEGKIGVGNAVDTLNFIADHYSKFDKTAYARLYGRAIIFKFASVLLSSIDEGYNAYKLYKRSDYNALFGSGLVVAAGVTELVFLCATKSLLGGPLGWIVGGVALLGGVIVMVASDSDFETFAHRCFFAKNRKDNELDTFIGSYWKWGTLVLKDINFQLHSLLTIFYKIEDPKFETKFNGFMITCYFNCRPENASIVAYIEFDGPGSSKPWIKIAVQKIGQSWPKVYARRSSDAPLLNVSTGGCLLNPDKKTGKWKLDIFYEVSKWNYLNNDFEDGWMKVYPFGLKHFDCPPKDKARRINSSFYEYNIIKIN